MEEARQHSALAKLYWISAILLGGSVALLLLGFVVPIPQLGSAIVVMMASGLFSRAVFFVLMFGVQRASHNPNARWAAFNAVAMSLFAVGFFVFVVLYHFRITG